VFDEVICNLLLIHNPIIVKKALFDWLSLGDTIVRSMSIFFGG
jgi:hypothetical protein